MTDNHMPIYSVVCYEYHHAYDDPPLLRYHNVVRNFLSMESALRHRDLLENTLEAYQNTLKGTDSAATIAARQALADIDRSTLYFLDTGRALTPDYVVYAEKLAL